MKKNVLILTPIYPSAESTKSITPVVHYYAKEWVKTGLNIIVIHSNTVYSDFFYKFPPKIYKYFESFFGVAIDRKIHKDNTEFFYENVKVKRLSIKKMIPRTGFSNNEIIKHYNDIYSYLNDINFKPDYILGHWDSPSLLLANFFKRDFNNIKLSVVLHGMPYLSKNKGANRYSEHLKYFDIIGFRSKSLMEEFNKIFPYFESNKFICYSGVPDEIINEISNNRVDKKFENYEWDYIYVGMLIKRKFPDLVLEALTSKTHINSFTYTVIGEGAVSETIRNIALKKKVSNKVHLLGRVTRNIVVEKMLKAQCFIMISKNEVFGLVYLEAMLAGCIVIASRNEGIDGIIKDGYNGFLCQAGNKVELEKVIQKIRLLPVERIKQISNNAIETAKQYSDSLVAKNYMNEINNLE